MPQLSFYLLYLNNSNHHSGIQSIGKLVAKRYEKHDIWKFLGFVQLETSELEE